MTEEEFLSESNYNSKGADDDESCLEMDMKCKKEILNNLTPEIKALFLTYETPYRKIVPYFVEDMSESTADRAYRSDFFKTDGFSKKNIYYVYENYTLDDNKPIYYGIETNPDYVYETRLDKRLIMLEREKGFASRKLIINVNEYQAKVYKACMIKKCAVEHKYLLNGEYMSARGYYDEPLGKSKVAKYSFVFKDSFFKYFFPDIYMEKQPFDVVELNDLAVVNFFSKQNSEVVNWLYRANARINKTISKTTKGVIIDNYIPYFDYVKIKESGKKIFAVEDVLDFISDKSPDGLFGKKRKISIPKYDRNKRDKIRDFLTINEEELRSFCNHKHGRASYKYWVDPFSSPELRDCLVEEELRSDLIKVIGDINNRKNDYEKLIKDFTKLGLFEEIVKILKNTDGLAYELEKAEIYSEIDK